MNDIVREALVTYVLMYGLEKHEVLYWNSSPIINECCLLHRRKMLNSNGSDSFLTKKGLEAWRSLKTKPE